MTNRPAHILIVDDEQLVEYMILQKFRREVSEDQYCFHFAPNGAEALTQLRSGTPIDMVLTDLRMPHMDGLTLLDRLKEIDPNIKTVVLSAYGDLPNIRAAMNRGAFDFLTKPIDLVDLDMTIQRTLGHITYIRNNQEQLRQAHEQLRYFAFQDVLTNLANRQWFVRMLDHAIQLNQRGLGYNYSILLIDLDRFKIINDSLGHEVGDYLLISVGLRIQECVRASDTVARLGGDEFAILLEDVREGREVEQVIQRILERLAEPFQIGDHICHVGASIGVTTSSIGYVQAIDALRDADVAMGRAKRHTNTYTMFNPAMQTQATARLQRETDIRQGLGRGEFYNHYQPIIDLSTGQPTGFEVLARWKHPEMGWIAPLDFISIAEDSGQIQALSRMLFWDACQQLVAWQEAFPERTIRLNINISPKQLDVPSFLSDMREALDAFSLPGECFRLELTESSLLDEHSAYTETMQALIKMNVQLCIDDFGTGYSSLVRLHAFPIAALKIDQSFIRHMTSSDAHLATVKVVIALAQMLSKDVVAEGLETEAERQILIDLGCTSAQGYLISQPLTAEAAFEYLMAHQPAAQF